MAKKPVAAAEPEDNNDSESQVETWLSALTDEGVRVRIMRQDESGNWALRAIKSKDAVTDEFLLKLGSGTYLLKALKPNGQIASQRTIHIEGDHAAAPAAPQSNGNAGEGGIWEKLFMMMQDQNNKTHQMLITLIGKESHGGADPVAMVNAMISGVTSMKQLAGGGDNGDGLDKLDKVLSIAERINNNNGPAEPKSVTDRLMEMASQVIPLLAAGAGQPPAQPATVTASERPKPALPDPTPAINPLKLEIEALWFQLKNALAKGFEPEYLAGMLLDQEELGSRGAAVIVESILKSASIDAWAEQAGGISDGEKPWFEKLWNEVHRQSKDEEPAAPTAPAAEKGTTE